MARYEGVSVSVIRRLPRYHRFLYDLLQKDIHRISSRELAELMNLTASQIRQDLNCFGGFGQQGYGYNVQHLHTEIGKILGLDRTYNMIILGAGNLGQALANYSKFARWGFKVIGIFDVDPELDGSMVRDIPIRMVSELPRYLKENDVQIAALTLPRNQAKAMAELVTANGVKAIWNFAHTDLKLPEDVIVESVHLSDSLMQLSYNMSNYKDKTQKKSRTKEK